MFSNSPSIADIAAVTDGNRNSGGWGDGNGWWVLIILFALFGCEVCSILLEKLLGAFLRQVACGKAELHRLLVECERFVERDAGRAYRLDDFIEAVANLIV